MNHLSMYVSIYIYIVSIYLCIYVSISSYIYATSSSSLFIIFYQCISTYLSHKLRIISTHIIYQIRTHTYIQWWEWWWDRVAVITWPKTVQWWWWWVAPLPQRRPCVPCSSELQDPVRWRRRRLAKDSIDIYLFTKTFRGKDFTAYHLSMCHIDVINTNNNAVKILLPIICPYVIYWRN